MPAGMDFHSVIRDKRDIRDIRDIRNKRDKGGKAKTVEAFKFRNGL